MSTHLDSPRTFAILLVFGVTTLAGPVACGSAEGGAPDDLVAADTSAAPEVSEDTLPPPEESSFSLCADDKDCTKSPDLRYCDVPTGQCVACKPGDAGSCPAGFMCDPKTIACVVICKAGSFHCEDGEVMQCDAGPPARWVAKATPEVCDASKGQACDAKKGACVALTPLGTTKPTGKYFQFAVFTPSNSEFKGGCGLDALGDDIYVNRDGKNLDIYHVTLEDTDGDGVLEPAQHPDNPKATGPMEKRTLKYVKTFTTAADAVPLGIPWDAEIVITPDRIFTNAAKGKVMEWTFATKTATAVGTPKIPWVTDPLQVLGYGEKDKLWYAGDAYARRVYSYSKAKERWVAEFEFPTFSGDHFDGMEVVVAPKTGIQYVYVSDMTSNYLGQYRRDDAGGWVQENLFQYNDMTGADVEGMGFGALGHFWVGNCGYGSGGVHKLYELGGGDLEEYTTKTVK